MKKPLLVLGLVALLAGPAFAKTEPMDVIADATEYNGGAHTYTVTGNVRIAFRTIKVTCRKATIYFTPKEDKVTRIVFVDNVQVERGPSTFQGRQVTYYVADQRLVAEGGTKTRINVNEVKGP